MSHLSNPLATAQQLYARTANPALPTEIQDVIVYHMARLTQAAAVLLRLPQSVGAQAVVLLQRYYLCADVMRFEFSVSSSTSLSAREHESLLCFGEVATAWVQALTGKYQDVSASTLYLTAKISAHPRSLRSITNVYGYLLSPSSTLASSPPPPGEKPDPRTYHVSEGTYQGRVATLLKIEGQILHVLGFNTHVSLPHPLCITYLQALDIFSTSAYSSDPAAAVGPRLARRAIAYLNSALLSPQLLYLTAQPNALAVAAIYAAARDLDGEVEVGSDRDAGVRLPEGEWWEVFDVEREELGFLVVAVRSLAGWIGEVVGAMDAREGVLRRNDVEREIERRGIGGGAGGNVGIGGEDEEDEMMRLMDERVGA